MEPITRKEKYLAKISGEDVQIPEKPITREEMYLNAIAQGSSGGDGYSKEEIDQKIQEVKNLIDTANNTLQKLENSLEGYVKNTDFATADNAGIIKPDGVGLDIQGDDGSLQIHHPTAEEIQAEGTDLEHQALTLDRVEDVAEYFGINNRQTIPNKLDQSTFYSEISKYATKTDVDNKILQKAQQWVSNIFGLYSASAWLQQTIHTGDVFEYKTNPPSVLFAINFDDNTYANQVLITPRLIGTFNYDNYSKYTILLTNPTTGETMQEYTLPENLDHLNIRILGYRIPIPPNLT